MRMGMIFLLLQQRLWMQTEIWFPTPITLFSLAVTGEGAVIATDNGNETSMESFQSPERKAFQWPLSRSDSVKKYNQEKYN